MTMYGAGSKAGKAARRAPRAPRAIVPPVPLDGPKLEALALAYVARFATSTGKLADYLARKLRERGWCDSEGTQSGAQTGAQSGGADIPALAARLAALGYIDDAAFAEAKGEGLRRRGYGARRIDSALGQAGIAPDLRAAARGSETERRHAALAFARRKRLWPYAAEPCQNRVMREKQVAAFLRAGHSLAHVRRVMDAESISDVEEWADEELDTDC
jgi:regulatory protein